jgi:methionine sulfoxide reductase heme-binding subunit
VVLARAARRDGVRTTTTGIRAVGALQFFVHVGAALPLVWLLHAVAQGQFGGDPVEGLLRFLGKGAIHLLLLTLAVSPLARALGMARLIRLRRPLGLWCFAWATLHFGVWLSLDLQFHWGLIASEIARRKYLLVGFATWAILLALAVTSVPRLMRAMKSYWKRLHNWIYAAALLAPLHYLWSVKSGLIEPAIYLVIAAVLLSTRRHALQRALARRGSSIP